LPPREPAILLYPVNLINAPQNEQQTCDWGGNTAVSCIERTVEHCYSDMKWGRWWKKHVAYFYHVGESHESKKLSELVPVLVYLSVHTISFKCSLVFGF
jgi:hypothetical protein